MRRVVSHVLIVGAALVAVIVVAATGFMVADRSQSDTYAATPLIVKNYAKSIEDCQSAAVQEIRFVRFDYTAFQQVWFTCANQVYLVDLMEDFDIRREKLTRQELDERVVLWMVVAITISGVFLAGLQLLGSYRLASAGIGKFGDDSTISGEAGAEANKLSIKSSVTGLIILVVSLAFFIVYVKWIYQIEEVNVEKPQSLLNAPTPGKITGFGGLGTSPSSPTPSTSVSASVGQQATPIAAANSSLVTPMDLLPTRSRNRITAKPKPNSPQRGAFQEQTPAPAAN